MEQHIKNNVKQMETVTYNRKYYEIYRKWNVEHKKKHENRKNR